MIYLDYSATTKVDRIVLQRFNEVSEKYFANPNQIHKEGISSNKVIENAIENIKNKLNIKNKEIIFTSGASEANNMVIKGINSNKKHIITTEFEHSSILAPIAYLQTLGYKITFLKFDKNGLIDIDDLKKQITDETFLVSINAVNSEIGIRQPIEEIGLLLKNYPQIIFHSDITQIIGKEYIDLANVDLASFSGHKIYTFKGIGGLIKSKDIKLIPLIHGGKSTSIYRSGTPQTELIDSISTALDILDIEKKEKLEHVKELNNKIKEHLKKYQNIVINSNDSCIAHILNISILGRNAIEIQKYFSLHDIYLSTRTACSNSSNMSLAIYRLTNDEERAKSSIRISLSYKTTLNEINTFLSVLDEYMEEI